MTPRTPANAGNTKLLLGSGEPIDDTIKNLKGVRGPRWILGRRAGSQAVRTVSPKAGKGDSLMGRRAT